MATDVANQDQVKDSTPDPNSAPSKLGMLLPALTERWLAEPTAEQLEAKRLRAEELAKADEQRELAQRAHNFSAFLEGREAYRGATLRDWVLSKDETARARQRVVLEAAHEFCRGVALHRQQGTGALFYGPPGTGKDHLATAIIRAACLQHGHTATFVNGVEWFVALRTAMDDGKKTEAELIRELTRPDWLVLSDPLPPVWDEKTGAGALTAYQAQMLYRVADERNGRGMPTIVTINVHSGDEAIRRLGGPTWDRLKHGAWVFACNWPSYRTPGRVV